MNTPPPRLPTWILTLTLPRPDQETVAGDLWEEYHGWVLPREGPARARLWYWGQVARSFAPLVRRTWERASLARATMALLAGAAIGTLPFAAIVAMRTFVLTQVPLRIGSDPSPLFLAALALVALTTGVLGCVIALHLLQSRARPPGAP